MLLIKNGYVLNPYSEEEGYQDILVDGDEIVKVEKSGTIEYDPEDTEVIDATGLYVAPGLMDVHVHFRDPGFTHKEDIETGAKAAARGGFTSVVLMANTKPAVDNSETLHYILDKAAKAPIRIFTCASVTKGLKGEELTDMEDLCEEGAVGFTDDGIPIMSEQLLREAMTETARLCVPISLHEENKELIDKNGINSGKASEFYGVKGSPREAEISLIERDVRIAAETGAILNIQHISSKEGVEIIRKIREEYPLVYAEVTPHHFSLTEEAVIEYGANAKMNPPLRTEEDRQALLEGIRDRTISLIATDHAPHAKEEKKKGIFEAPSGIIGLETAFSLGIMNLVDSGVIDLMQLIRLMAVNPRKVYGFDAKGLEPGGIGDIILFDPKEEWTYDSSYSKSNNTPFWGKTMKGKIKQTICRGCVVYKD